MATGLGLVGARASPETAAARGMRTGFGVQVTVLYAEVQTLPEN